MIANSTVSTNAIIFILSGDHFLLEEAGTTGTVRRVALRP
jgi:hypothetical protein